jgi:sterol desaturase/sphingolipid hydroxylase (fatty acid hydroxylase superfamily)/uncharacterized membrane protein YhhN
MSFVIVLAAPVFFLLILAEWLWGLKLARQGQASAQTYRLDDAISSISLGMISQIAAIFTRLLRIGIYTLVFEQLSLFPEQTWWNTWYGYLLALVFYDLCYYWFHRVSHEVAWFWGGHAVHHQSHHYNLSTALRQSTSGVLLGWIFYIPMALAGVPPLVFGIVALIDLLYQFWVHTEHVGRLGWFDRWFCSPSNHRVHHAVNDGYVDRNYGGIWVVWDRLFGSFKEEDQAQPCIYGTRTPLHSWDPLWANVQVYAELAHDSWHAKRWQDKLMVWLRHPGWRPADVAARFPKPAFDVQQFSPYQPRQTRATLVLASAWFVLLLAATMKLLWHMDDMVWSQAATCVLAVSAGLWAVNTLLQNRISGAMCAFVQMAALTVASQVCGWQELFQMAKPLALLALMYGAWSASHLQPQVQKWLVRALGLSWVGDVLLLYPSMFLPGLVAFLAAHVCYIVLLSRDAPWLHSRRALAVFMSIAALVFVLLDQHGLPADLRVPVAAYVLVIATMAAQAWGRAKHLGTAGSHWLAWGSVLFMLSDTLLAVDKFVSPMPVAGLWVLTTYYLAQGFIVQGRLSSQTHTKVGKA